MKSILIGLLFINSTVWCQPSTPDSTYCIPIGKARLLVAEALSHRILVRTTATLEQRVDLLESQNLAQYRSFTNLLKIEQEKYTLQKENTGHMERLALSYKGQMEYYQKREKKQRRKKNVLGGTLVVVIILSILK